MKKVLAVSGGIDSVVMLHLFRNDPDVIVAHFDHGIRANSAEDCAFVERLAKSYGLPFFSTRARLGADCSEETARAARYAFLKKLAKEQSGRLYTAHHCDDLIESAAINLLRGTGWRGIAPMSDPLIERPLLNMTKQDIYRYAAEHSLSFREDQTNSDDKYLRNRVRARLRQAKPSQKRQFIELVLRQRAIAAEVDTILMEFQLAPNYPRALFDDADAATQELLRHILHQNHISLTRPQLSRALTAIQDFAPGKRFSLDKTHFLKISKYNFSITSG